MFMPTIWILIFFKLHNCAKVCETNKNASESIHEQSKGETLLKPVEYIANSMLEENPPLCCKQPTQELYHSHQNMEKISFDEKEYILQQILVSIKGYKELYESKKPITSLVKQILEGLEIDNKNFPPLQEQKKTKMSDSEDSTDDEMSDSEDSTDDKMSYNEDSTDDETSKSDEELTSSEKNFIYNGEIGDEKMDLDDFMVVQVKEKTSEANEAIDAIEDNFNTSKSFQGEYMNTGNNIIAEDQHTQCVEMSLNNNLIDSRKTTESVKGKTNRNMITGDDYIAKNERSESEESASIENSADSSEDEVGNDNSLHAELKKQFCVSPTDLSAYAKDLSQNNGVIEENGTISYMKSSLFHRRDLQKEINKMRTEFMKKKTSLVKTEFLGHKIDLTEKKYKYQSKGLEEEWFYDNDIVCMKKLARNKILTQKKMLARKIVPLSTDKHIYFGELAEKINVDYLEVNGWNDDFYQLLKDKCKEKIAKKIAKTANKLTYTKIQLSFLSDLVPEETRAELEKKSDARFQPYIEQCGLEREKAEIDDKNRRKNFTKDIINLFEYEDEFLEFEQSKQFRKFYRVFNKINGFRELDLRNIMYFIRQAMLKPLEDLNKCRKTIHTFLEWENYSPSRIFWSFLNDEIREIKMNSIVLPEIKQMYEQKTSDEDKMVEIMIEQLFRHHLTIIKDSDMFLREISQHSKAKFEMLIKCFTRKSTIYLNKACYFEAKNVISDVIYKILSGFIFNFSKDSIEHPKTKFKQPRKNLEELDICYVPSFKLEDNVKVQNSTSAFGEWSKEFESCLNFICENLSKKARGKHDESEKDQGGLIMLEKSKKMKLTTKEDRIDVFFVWYVFYMLTYTNYFIDNFFIINKEIPKQIFYDVLITYDNWESFSKTWNPYYIDLEGRSFEEWQSAKIKDTIWRRVCKYKIELTKILEDLFILKTISLRDK